MRRWFTVFFVFHLLVSLGFFAPAQSDTRDAAANALQAAATLVVALGEPGPQGEEPLAPAPDHSLTESASELPECLQPTTTVLVAGGAPTAPALRTDPAPTPPVIDGPHRPPKPRHVLA